MNRRDFINKVKIISAGTILIPPFLAGCENELLPFEDDEPEKYIPLVNDVPYFDRDYFFQRGTGSFPSFSFEGINQIHLIDKNRNPINGLESLFYGDKISKRKFVSISDPQRRYLPRILSLDNRKGLARITMLERKEGDINNGGIGSDLRGLFVKEIKEGLPRWDFEKMCEKPGMVYLGDWSFDNVKELNTNLNRGSGVIALATLLNPIPLKVFAVTAKVGGVLKKVDFLIDKINLFTPLEIDKYKQHSIYQFPFEQTTTFIYLAQRHICSQMAGDINKLFPLHPNNSWTYQNNSGRTSKFEFRGTRKINGRDLLVVRNQLGGEEYFGFNGRVLGQYGIRDSSLGNIFFNPPIILGDNNVFIGKRYNMNSKIICEAHPRITGSVQGSSLCEARETIVLRDGKPYGDCFRIQEKSNLVLTNQGNNISTNVSATHWYAKNVGKIKLRFGGLEWELTDSVINVKSGDLFYNQPISTPQLITEKIKELI